MRRIRSAARAEALGRLLEVSIHDLSNILTAVGGYAHLLDGSVGSAEPQRGYARQLVEAADRGTALLVHLKRVAAADPFEPEALDLNDAASQFADMFGEVAGARGVALRLEPAAGRVRFDLVRLERVLFSFALNACLAGEDKLVVGTERLTEGRRAAVSVGLKGALPPSPVDSHRLFADGVGLMLAFALVAEAGGRLAVEPGPGRPRAFAALLPAL